MPGYVAFKTMLDGAHGVQLNPSTPLAIHFTNEAHRDHDRGRKLVAVFTANDTAQAFVRQHGARLGGSLRVLLFSGEKLFRTLAQREMDGIVFNCSGPIPARAFQAAFARSVLDG